MLIKFFPLKRNNYFWPIEEKKFDFNSLQNKTYWSEYELQVIRSMLSNEEQENFCLHATN